MNSDWKIVELAEPPQQHSQQARRQKKSPSRRSVQFHSFFLIALIIATALAVGYVLRIGWDYYTAALADRPQHPLHTLLRPSGLIGQGSGIIGALFCFLTLLYPIRKRWRLLENAGAPRIWFRFHIYFGIAGPLFGTLHTAFKFGGLASISYWSMMIVMVSGFIGRFIFALLPRNKRGLLLSVNEIDTELSAIRAELATLGISQKDSAVPINPNTSAPVWINAIKQRRLRRRTLQDVNRRLIQQEVTPASRKRILSLLSRRMLLQGSVATLGFATRAFSHWHSLHLPFTYLMFVTLVVHVVLMVLLGYTWIF